MIPRLNTPSLSITPVANPVDPGVRHGPPKPVAVDTKLGQLAAALSHINPALQTFLQHAATQEQHEAGLQGQKAAHLHKTFESASGIYQGDATYLPAFRKSFMESKGRLAGSAYAESLSQAYEQWGDKNRLEFQDSPTGEKALNHSHFLEFVGQVRQPHLEQETRSRETQSQQTDPDWIAGFMPMMQMAELNLLNHHTSYLEKLMKEERFQTLEQEVFKLLDHQGLDPHVQLSHKEIGHNLNALQQEAVHSGLNPHQTQERMSQAILTKALEVGGLQGKQMLDLIKSPSGRSLSAEWRHKILSAKDHIDQAAYRRGEQLFHLHERQKQQYREHFHEHMALKLLENPAYRPSPQEEQQAIHNGVWDLPERVEHMRGAFLSYQKEHNPQEELEFHRRLEAGLVTLEEIFYCPTLSHPEKMKAIEKYTHHQQLIMSHPLIQAGEDRIDKELGVLNTLEAMLLGLSDQNNVVMALSANARMEYRTIVLNQEQTNPALKEDPTAFAAEIQKTVEPIIKKSLEQKKGLLATSATAQNSVPTTGSQKFDVAPLVQDIQTFAKFKNRQEIVAAIRDYNKGQGKLKAYFQHKPKPTQEQFDAVFNALLETTP